jgi:hypothetical protein
LARVIRDESRSMGEIGDLLPIQLDVILQDRAFHIVKH